MLLGLRPVDKQMHCANIANRGMRNKATQWDILNYYGTIRSGFLSFHMTIVKDKYLRWTIDYANNKKLNTSKQNVRYYYMVAQNLGELKAPLQAPPLLQSCSIHTTCIVAPTYSSRTIYSSLQPHYIL